MINVRQERFQESQGMRSAIEEISKRLVENGRWEMGDACMLALLL